MKITGLFSGGPIPFVRFMQAALYDPAEGYYAANIRTVGRRGDFSTSATLHAFLGAAIAKWLGRFSPSFSVIEVGAGNGALAKSVLAHLPWWKRWRMRYHIVETSRPLREEQQKTLRGKRVSWHEDMDSALAASRGKACIFSNELADAFPCHVFVREGGEWHELALELRGGAIRETLLPAALPENLRAEMDAAGFADGQRIEMALPYRQWLESWMPAWRKGEMLTIDYGGLFPQLYHRRPLGTLRGFFHHQWMEGAMLYQNIGRQDITADVNFSLLEKWGADLGLRTLHLETQRDFIRRQLGKEKLGKNDDPALQYLLQAPGPGDAFLALLQLRDAIVRVRRSI